MAKTIGVIAREDRYAWLEQKYDDFQEEAWRSEQADQERIYCNRLKTLARSGVNFPEENLSRQCDV